MSVTQIAPLMSLFVPLNFGSLAPFGPVAVAEESWVKAGPFSPEEGSFWKLAYSLLGPKIRIYLFFPFIDSCIDEMPSLY